MCKHCEIAWIGEVLSRQNFVDVLTFWVIDPNQCFLFETSDLVSDPVGGVAEKPGGGRDTRVKVWRDNLARLRWNSHAGGQKWSSYGQRADFSRLPQKGGQKVDNFALKGKRDTSLSGQNPVLYGLFVVGAE
ncbi:MAG: hypothetical protein V2I32_00005 [Desulforhopalus sp.]|nr:hypothetical protein [Desulforhopalus sp.]